MEITANIDAEDFAQEIVQVIMDSVDFDSHVNGLIESLLTDQINEAIENIDIDEIDGFERRVDDIARDTASEVLDDEIAPRIRDAVEQAMADAPDPQDSDDRIANLEQQVEGLTETVDRLVDALSAAALLLGVVVKG